MIKKALFIASVFMLLGGCSNNLSLLAPYKENVSVYGLLNQDDPVQYIRIERVFLGEQNAYTMAQNQDSVYFKSGDIKVTLQRWKNNIQVSVDNPATSAMEIVLTDTLLQADVGVFNQNERVYKTNHKLYSDSQYKLTIHNNKSGKEFTAQTGLIGSFQLLLSNPGEPNAIGSFSSPFSSVNITPSFNGKVFCYYNSPVNAGVCGLTMRFFYTENNGGINSQKFVDIELGSNYTLQTVGGEKQEFDFAAGTVLNNLSYLVPVNTSVNRAIDSLQFLLTAAGQPLALYNQINSSTSLSQTKANYSNINGGIGVFSCRNELKMKRLVADVSKDTIAANSQTCKLRFEDHSGIVHPCH